MNSTPQTHPPKAAIRLEPFKLWCGKPGCSALADTVHLFDSVVADAGPIRLVDAIMSAAEFVAMEDFPPEADAVLRILAACSAHDPGGYRVELNGDAGLWNAGPFGWDDWAEHLSEKPGNWWAPLVRWLEEGAAIKIDPSVEWEDTTQVLANADTCSFCGVPGHEGRCKIEWGKLAAAARNKGETLMPVPATATCPWCISVAGAHADTCPVKPPSGFAALLEYGPVWRSRAGDEPAMVIPGILVSRGFAMVGGGAKEGKTWALVDMMLSIANDRPFMGTEIANPGPVLFISAEGSHPGTVARFDMLARGKGLDPDRAMDHIDLLFRRNIMLDDPECLAYLRSIAPKYAAIIADPLVKLWNGDEDKAKDVGPFTRNLTEIAERGPAFILSHHTVKVSETSKDRNPWLNIRGSGQWYGALDSGLYVERGKGATRTLVRFSGKDYAPVSDVTFTWPDTQAHATDSVELDWQPVDESRRTGIQAQELAAVQFATTTPGLSMTALSELLPGRATNRRDAIKGLLANGTLEARLTPGRTGSGGIYVTGHEQYVPLVGT